MPRLLLVSFALVFPGAARPSLIGQTSPSPTLKEGKWDTLRITSTKPSGRIDGIRGRGGYEVSKGRIVSSTGSTPVVRHQGRALHLGSDKRISVVK